jgi:glutamyl/glutaminyl-tRNA synthetase
VLSNENADLITSKQSQKVLIDLQIRINRADFLNGEKFKNIVMETGNETTTQGKELFFPIRTAIYGCPKGPDLPLLFSILGKKEILKRISKLIIS